MYLTEKLCSFRVKSLKSHPHALFKSIVRDDIETFCTCNQYFKSLGTIMFQYYKQIHLARLHTYFVFKIGKKVTLENSKELSRNLL